MEQKKAIIQEIYRRGLQDRLPPEKRQIADELVRRGVIQIEAPSQEPIQEQIQEPIEQPPEEEKFVGGIAGDPRSLEALGRGALKGATYGLSRRVTPYMAAGVAKLAGVEEPYGELVEESKEIEAERERKLREERPAEFAGAEIAGALVSPAGVPAARAAQRIGGIKGAVGVGAAEGAVIGAGYGENLGDIKESALVGGLLGGGLGLATRGAGIAFKALKPLTGRITPKRAEATKLVQTLKKEGVTPDEARAGIQKMQDEGIALIDVVDPRSSIIAEVPERAFERKTIDTIDNYVNQLNTAGNKAKTEVLDLVSKNKISATEGAELLGQNAQKAIKEQKRIMRAKVKPLYEKADKDFIPENDPILQIPVIKDAIEKAKNESKKFGAEGFASIEGKADNSFPVLHQAKSYLYRKSRDFNDVEYARYGQAYNQLSTKMKNVSKSYDEASELWASEAEGLERLYKQKGIGNIAKKYEAGDLDGIQSSFRNIFNKTITDEQVTRLKNSLPDEQFNAIVRKDLDTLISESGDTGRNLTNSLFGKGDVERSLKNKRLDLIFNPRQKRGLRKTSELLDSAVAKEKQLGKLALRTPKQQFEYIYGGQFAIANALLKVGRSLSDSPQQREAFVNYLFTPAGQQLLEQIARSNKRDAQNLIMQTIPAILTQTQGE
jgi:hypothetical protein